MFDKLFKRSSKILGISAHADGIALAVVEAGNGCAVHVHRTLWVSRQPETGLDKRLADAVKSLKAKRIPAVLALEPSLYHLLQIEAPDIEESEMAEAARWRIKDMVDFSIDQAAVDVFDLPLSQRPGAPHLMYAVAADNTVIQPLIEQLLKAKVDLQAVDIAEMALRNLVNRSDSETRPRAFMHLSPSVGIIEINHQSEIHLLRNMTVGAESVLDNHSELINISEGLALEVQRSLDYFESQYGLGQVDALQLIAPDASLAEAFKQAATAFLTVPVIVDELKYLQGIDLSSEENVAQKLMAVGAGSRDIPWVA